MTKKTKKLKTSDQISLLVKVINCNNENAARFIQLFNSIIKDIV